MLECYALLPTDKTGLSVSYPLFDYEELGFSVYFDTSDRPVQIASDLEAHESTPTD